jgi:hypothetical protein
LYNRNSFQDSLSAFTGQSDGYQTLRIGWGPGPVAVKNSKYSYFKSTCPFCQLFQIRFVMQSDSIPDNKPGWLIDNIVLYRVLNSIKDNTSILVKVYPTNTRNLINIQSNSDFDYILIYSMQGKIVYHSVFSKEMQINISAFIPGTYSLSLVEKKSGSVWSTLIVKQ